MRVVDALLLVKSGCTCAGGAPRNPKVMPPVLLPLGGEPVSLAV